MKKIILFCLASLLIFLLSNPVAYSGLTEEQKKLQRYKEQLKYVQQQIANVNYNESSVIALLGNLEAEVQGVRQNISVIQNKISVLEKEISEKKQIIAENEKLIEENKKAIYTALNLSYKMSEISPVELLFSGQDINSSADKVAYISYIAGANKNLLDELTEKTKILKQQKEELIESEKNLSAFLAEKRQEESVLKQEVELKNQLLATLKQKKLEYLTQKSILEQEIKNEQKKIEELIRQANNGKMILKGGLIWPVRGPITSPFGWRTNPIWHAREFHPGIDIAVATGTPVKVAAAGMVSYAGWLTGYGNVVIIYHGSDVSTLYAHLKKYVVRKGQLVKQGQIIAYSDNTGWSTGPHLHFGVYLGDKPVDPLKYLP
jgi:murein DD-endopeptidase MepM/ murein hydrolase activator NlpD